MTSKKHMLYGFFIEDNKNLDGLSVLESIQTSTIEEIYGLISEHRQELRPLKPNNIPQFSKIEDVYKVLRVLSDAPEEIKNWEGLGYYLCAKDAKPVAKTKYGENHYKLATQLGLALEKTPLEITEIGMAVHLLSNKEEKDAVLAKLILRVPVIQHCMIEAENGIFDANELLRNYLSESTVIRRRSNVKKLLSIISENSNDRVLQHILTNIVWVKT